MDETRAYHLKTNIDTLHLYAEARKIDLKEAENRMVVTRARKGVGETGKGS